MNKQDKWKARKLVVWAVALVLMVLAVPAVYFAATGSASALKITEIDYNDLKLVLETENSDTVVQFATSKTAKTWETVPGTIQDNKIEMDISWVSASKNTTLYFKGDKSTEIAEVTLPKQNKLFRVSYVPAENKMSFKNIGDAGEDNIYWKKSRMTTWTLYNEEDMQKKFDEFCTKGITLYFRTGQKKGTSSAEAGFRPSKVVSAKVPKRGSAPKVTLDYSKLAFNVKATMEYRLSGSEAQWTPITSTLLKIADAAPEALYNSESPTDKEEISVDFRTKATTKNVASKTCTVKVPVQKEPPATADGILSYTGMKQCKIASTTASSSTPFEYTVVKEGEAFDTTKAKWTAVTKASTLISIETAPENSTVYYRKKTSSGSLASAAVTWKVNYPPSPLSGGEETTLTKIQGTDIWKGDKNTFSVYVTGDKDVKINSITCNGAAVEFTASEASPVTEGEVTKYLITVTVTGTKAVEKNAENLSKDNDLVISLDNLETISDKVKLHIQKAASAEAAAYSKYVNVPMGPVNYSISLNEQGKADETVKVASIVFNGVNLVEGAGDDFTQVLDTENAKVSVTILGAMLDRIPNILKKSEYSKLTNFVVTLTNGEVLQNLQIKVGYPATVSSSSSTLGISKGMYAVSGTAASAYTNPVITYTLDSKVIEECSYRLESLTWNGSDVLGNYEQSGEYSWKITMSMAKLLKLPTGSGYLVAKFRNTEVGQSTEGRESIEINYGYYIDLRD